MRVAVIAIAAFAPAACATVDREEVDARLPDRAGFAAEAPVEKPAAPDWLATFDSPQMEALVGEALARNNSLAASAATYRSSRELARQSRAGLLPRVEASFDASRQGTVFGPQQRAVFGSDRVYFNQYSAGVLLSWELDIFGRLADGARAAFNDAAAARADFEGARLSLAGRTAQAWFNLVEARQQRELAERDVDNRSRSYAVTDRRYGRGVSTSLDVRLSRSALASAEATLALRQRNELEASRALEVLLGRYPAAELAAPEALPKLPGLPDVGTPGDVLAQRPDVLAAERRMAAAGLRAREARKALLPQLTLTTPFSSNEEDFEDAFNINRIGGSIIAGLVQPLFQGGRLRSQARQRKRQMQGAVFDYVEAALNAFQEAENALGAETLLEKQETALRLAFEEAAAAQELTERRYASGRATIFELLDAQQRRITAESQYITIVRDRLSNRVSLHLAVGGAFEAPAFGPSADGQPVADAAETSKGEAA
ncbi:MAG: TolC family protein [Pseudomonadota bacterium]